MKKGRIDLSVVILAGGLATRLGPLTSQTPKSLLQINDKPFLSYQLEYLKRQGIYKIVLCLGHLSEQIIEVFGDGSNHGVQILYSLDGPKPLGTGGAIRNALNKLGNNFIVLYGDTYPTAPLGPILNRFIKSKKSGLMTVYKNSNRFDKSNVIYKDKLIMSYDKSASSAIMNHIDYGINLFYTTTFQDWPINRQFDLSEVIKKLISDNDLAGFEVRDRFYEIGSVSGINEFKQKIDNENIH